MIGAPGVEPPGVAKAKTVFYCSACGHESARWLGRCPQCEAWNSYEEAPSSGRPGKVAAPSRSAAVIGSGPVRLAEIDERRIARLTTGMPEFDTALGGGIVPGSLVLLGGPPGAGKSTLLLQIAEQLAERGSPAVYVCGEESAAQTKLRAQRIGVGDELLVFPETNVRAILDDLERRKPSILIIDSIQTMWLPDVDSRAASRRCATARKR
jgi:DNA repair protein RadA/Sms